MSLVDAARVRPAGRVAALAVLTSALLSGVGAIGASTANANHAHAPLAAQRWPWLTIGSTGSAVRYVQLRVHVTPSGIYGPITAHAVYDWEKRHHVPSPNGVVGPVTWKALHVPYHKAAVSSGWTRPIHSYRLSARFGASGSLWSSGHHTGQDFAAPTGTAVYAAASGTIISARTAGAYGNRIMIRHAGGTQTWYCHLSAFVRHSGSVSAGSLIGRVGSTGNTTGPHLHFEVHPGGGSAVDPLAWLRARGVRM